MQTRRNGSKTLADGKAPSKPLGRVPRITRLVVLACRNLVRDGVIINQSELAHYGQISTTRTFQIMWLDNLVPDVQDTPTDYALVSVVCADFKPSQISHVGNSVQLVTQYKPSCARKVAPESMLMSKQ